MNRILALGGRPACEFSEASADLSSDWRPGSAEGGAVSAAPGLHRCDESATGYSLASCTPAVLASASPALQHGEPMAGNRQPPPSGGWGIFDRNFGDFRPVLTPSKHDDINVEQSPYSDRGKTRRTRPAFNVGAGRQSKILRIAKPRIVGLVVSSNPDIDHRPDTLLNRVAIEIAAARKAACFRHEIGQKADDVGRRSLPNR